MMVGGFGLTLMDLEPGCKLESRDFFRTRAQMPLRETFLLAGARCQISTNSESILDCARKLFASLPTPGGNPELDFRFWVDPTPAAISRPLAKPYFRGLGRFVFAGFDGLNSLLVDLNRGQAAGRFTRAFAEDTEVWQKIVFPILPAFLSPSIPVSILHGACVEHGGRGLLMVGPSGTGKSTLTLALGRAGCGFLADDRTYLSLRNGRLFAWSVGGFLKLRSEGSGHFPMTQGRVPGTDPKGESILELDPESDLGFRRVKCCEPHSLVFLERGPGSNPELRQAGRGEILAGLEQHLKCDSPDADFQREVLERLAQLPAYFLHNQGSPQSASNALLGILDGPAGEPRAQGIAPLTPIAHPRPPIADPLRRATPLNHILSVTVMGRPGRIETNSSTILATARKLFSVNAATGDAAVKFTWRIVSEMDGKVSPPWPSSAAFSSQTLRFVNIGQRSFAAVNLETAEVAGFISEGLAQDEPGFASIFLATLFYLTAPILGLTPLKAGCVSKDGRGLLLLGPAGSGKTSCAYAACKLGLEYNADMASFLELEDGKVRAWGEFWPALFREQTTCIYPELKYLGRRLEHASETFVAIDKGLLCPQAPGSVTLALAVRLERGVNESPRMTRLSTREYWDALQASPPHEEQGGYKMQQEQLLAKLARIPAYKLSYGNNSGEAAIFCRSLLTAQDILKAVR